MRRAAGLFLALVTTVAAAVTACGSDEEVPAAPTTDAGPSAEASAPADGGDAAATSCTAVDIPEGKGAPFCDLPGTDTPDLVVPPGFCVREFTTNADGGQPPVGEARVLRFAPNGDLFVAAPSMATVGGSTGGPGAVVVLPDDDKDGKADAVVTFAGPSVSDGRTCAALEAESPASLACVHGLHFQDGYLYFTRSDDVRRWPYQPGQRKAPAGAGELVATLGVPSIPDARWTHTLEGRKDGSILVSRGRSDSSACSAEEMTRGAVFALHVAGAPKLPLVPDLVADGFRNPMYLRCAPNSCGECYASELSGDDWDGVGGREKLSLLGQPGESWGYPCCVGRDEPHPGAGATSCANVGKELVAIPLHDTNFGLDFDRGGFPAPYRHGLFVALHGVFTSFGGTGVVWLGADPVTLRPTGKAELFIRGFGKPNGRATDAVFAPDGRLFVADDTLGKIYWVAPRTLKRP